MSSRGSRGLPPRPYKVLCVSSLHPKASDDVVRDTLYREYKKYGDISVRYNKILSLLVWNKTIIQYTSEIRTPGYPKVNLKT